MVNKVVNGKSNLIQAVFLFFITLNIANSIKIKISLGTGDFCGYKVMERLDDLQIDIKLTNKEKPENSKINLNIINLTDGEFLLNLNQIPQALKKNVVVNRSAEYKFCFKPIYSEEVEIEFFFNTKSEHVQAFEIAHESKIKILNNIIFILIILISESFEPIKQDLHDLHELTVVLDQNSKTLSRKKWDHSISKDLLLIYL